MDSKKATEYRREIKRLKNRVIQLNKLLSLVNISCNQLHHEKDMYHEATEPCPVETLFENYWESVR